MPQPLIDVAKIKVTAGDGGDGHVSFHRAKFVPQGGPDGGDGGSGGDVYLVADSNMATLMDFRAKPKYKAADGREGGRRQRHGESGEDLYIKVPVGTLVYENRPNHPSGEILVGDLVKGGQTLLICRGGRGGRGNARFKSSTNRAPRQYTEGTKGESKELRLEIKIIADVGLVGLPNAGKSTLINRLTSSRAKIGSYPFTTLSPNLGVWKLVPNSPIVVADIPGLIEGASKGKGLGDEFLRHVERTSLLVHVIDPFSGLKGNQEDVVLGSVEELAQSAWKAYTTIREELADYSEDLAEKKEIVVINKADITEISESLDAISAHFKKEGIEVLGISAATGEGIANLQEKVLRILPTLPETKVFQPEPVVKTYNIRNLPNRRMVFGATKVQEKES